MSYGPPSANARVEAAKCPLLSIGLQCPHLRVVGYAYPSNKFVDETIAPSLCSLHFEPRVPVDPHFTLLTESSLHLVSLASIISTEYDVLSPELASECSSQRIALKPDKSPASTVTFYTHNAVMEDGLYLIRLVQMHESFRLPELHALAAVNGLHLGVIEYDKHVRCESRPFADLRRSKLYQSFRETDKSS